MTFGDETAPWDDALLAAALFAVDPAGAGGIVVRALAGPTRDHWLALLRDLLPLATPWRRVPIHIADSRLLGGLDLAATLNAGRPVAERGLLAEANGGVVLLAMAERLSPSNAARITAVLDQGEVVLERDGLAMRTPTQFGVIAFDEGNDDEERPAATLLDRLAFHLEFSALRARDGGSSLYSSEQIIAARHRLPMVRSSPEVEEALCATAMALGIASIRAVLLALRVAHAAAALDGRPEISEADAVLAGRLVLAARATRMPAAEPAQEEEEPAPPEENPDRPDEQDQDSAKDDASGDQPEPEITAEDIERLLQEVVLAATQAAIPAGLLAQLKIAGAGNARTRSSGKAGALQRSSARGRPAGARRGEPKAGVRLNVVETLRAAAPWQRLRRVEDSLARQGASSTSTRVFVRREDFHVTRYQQRSETTTIFVVDASGSSALNRLAEAKGAVELLLADCYVRRDRVAVLAFRGRGAELLLPPTRSLVRAKRSLAGLPGGGGTPLATGIDAAVMLADAARRRGETPNIVFLTDGNANVARDGSGGRKRAEDEALIAARQLRLAGFTALFVDTSPRAQPLAQRLASEMQALYLPLPYADAKTLSAAVKASASSSR